jgi:RNA polymerase sigma-70 factor (ECF subfamily)
MIASVLAGDSEQFQDLIRPYVRSVYRVARSLVQDESHAEKVVQEAVITAFRKLADFRRPTRFAAWLITITLNAARGRLLGEGPGITKSVEHTCEAEQESSRAQLSSWSEIPAEALERKETQEILQSAIHDLCLACREVLLLRDMEGFSIEETAAVLAIDAGTVKVRLHRARLTILKKLASQLGGG